MTAEVSIMNKHGMSMAADSAITSGFDGVPKVYNSANKLFPLSKEHPIGFYGLWLCFFYGDSMGSHY